MRGMRPANSRVWLTIGGTIFAITPADKEEGDGKYADDGARPGKSLALEKIDDGIEQISHHARDRQRPKHGREDVQHAPKSPNQQNN